MIGDRTYLCFSAFQKKKKTTEGAGTVERVASGRAVSFDVEFARTLGSAPWFHLSDQHHLSDPGAAM